MVSAGPGAEEMLEVEGDGSALCAIKNLSVWAVKQSVGSFGRFS